MNEDILKIGSNSFLVLLVNLIEYSLFEKCIILRDALIEYEEKYKIMTYRDNVIGWYNGLDSKRKKEYRDNLPVVISIFNKFLKEKR